MNHRPRVIALTGPTGCGKTELGIALARRFDAEIINADSRQVFRGLDIGSAKPTREQRAAVPHHLFDVVNPDEHFDCARYRTMALAAVDEITQRKRRVLFVGGTNLYLKVLRGGLFRGPARDAELRAQLEAQENAAPGSLHRRLSQVDAAAAARLHPNDRMRLIRALEVYELTGRPISDWQQEHSFAGGELEMRIVALALARDEIYRRIELRCDAMIANGLIEEMRDLLATGYHPMLPALQSTGYREISEYVRGLCDLATARERMVRATRRLAKRQLTWLRGDANLEWCLPDIEALSELVRSSWEP